MMTDGKRYFVLDVYGGYNRQELLADGIEVYARTEGRAKRQAIDIYKKGYDYNPEDNKFGLRAVIVSGEVEQCTNGEEDK